jgi:hypothetical protein
MDLPLALRLPRVFKTSGLIRDHELLGEMVREGNQNAREAVLKAIGRVEDGQRPEALLSSLAAIADRTQGHDGEHANALMALGASGPAGEERLIRLSRDPTVPIETRLLSLESLSSDRDPQAPALALELIPSCRSVWAMQTAIELAVENDSRRAELVQAIDRWMSEHSGLADELREALSRAAVPEVRNLSR